MRVAWPWLFILTFGSFAGAQTLLPLDSRPATRIVPALIAGLHRDQVRVPPAELLGTAKTGADPAALTAWLAQQPAGQPLVVALDALAYGGLVQSRSSTLSVQAALERLQVLRDWKIRTGQPIYAFITLPREPDATDRARNLAVVRTMMNWAREGILTELHVTWDDALEGSPAPQEGAALATEAPANVRVYPGADEVLSLLIARSASPLPRTLRVEYSDPDLAGLKMPYEGISLIQSTRNHAEASGFTVTEAGEADLTLYVYNGGVPRQAALRVSTLLRKGPVAIADVARVNMGNLKLWGDLDTLRRPQNLAALAAWGTPGNNLGTALAHAKLFLDGVENRRQDALLAYEYANDVIYSAKLRAQLRQQVPEAQLNTPQAQALLDHLAQAYFPLVFAETYALDYARLPWGRSFEWEFSLRPEPAP